MREDQPQTARGYRFFEWVNRRILPISIVVIVIAVMFGVIAPIVAAEGEPEFEPGGEIYDTADLVEDRLSTDSPIRGATFVVEAAGAPELPNAYDHDVLTAAALREFKAHSDSIRAEYSAGEDAHLVSTFSYDIGAPIDGIYSIADAVDETLPGGLGIASDADVKRVLSGLLADEAPTAGLRFTLSRLATRDREPVDGVTITVWRAPAFLAHLRYDIDTFDPAQEVEGFDQPSNLDAERWLREVQTDLRGDQEEIAVLGIAIDGGLAGEEQNAAAAPYIFLAVAFILILVGALLRSYWAAMITAIGLSVVMMSYNGINAFIGLKVQSPLIILIVPIALISFGVDFFIHASGRAREGQVEGLSRERAYPVGATMVFTALLLAAASSVGAFLSNAASGVQAITEFGIAAAVAIALSYLILGLFAPRQLLAVEEFLGPRPEDKGLHILRRLGYVGACVLAGIVVTLSIVMPSIGAGMFVVVLLGGLFGLPLFLTRRRNRRAAAAGAPLSDEVKGAGHGFVFAGDLVHFLARWRVVTVPVVLLLAILGVVGWTQVESAFEFKDFFNPNTDFVRSLDKIETHLGQSASGPGYIYVEGDLTDPQALQAMESVFSELDRADEEGRVELIRDFNGELDTGTNAASLVRAAMDPAAQSVLAAAGVAVTDDDGDGLPDSSQQVAAVYDYLVANGVPGADGRALLRPDQVQAALYVDGETQGTALAVYVPSITDDANVLDLRAILDQQATSLEQSMAAIGPVSLVSASGGAITAQDGLASFTESMLTSLPIAIVVTILLALLVMRSVRYAMITMVPILLVVAWVYGFMYIVGFKINVITATIAAISIGVGIDYATHFTVRFREEFAGEPSRFPALRRAGEGTGGALAISALTSITGFVVMATAPMPMFATFGVLTAVMILFALLVSLVMLPSLLLLVTPSRKGDERAELEEAITGGEFEYRPHARATAELRRRHHGVRAEDDEAAAEKAAGETP